MSVGLQDCKGLIPELWPDRLTGKPSASNSSHFCHLPFLLTGHYCQNWYAHFGFLRLSRGSGNKIDICMSRSQSKHYKETKVCIWFLLQWWLYPGELDHRRSWQTLLSSMAIFESNEGKSDYFRDIWVMHGSQCFSFRSKLLSIINLSKRGRCQGTLPILIHLKDWLKVEAYSTLKGLMLHNQPLSLRLQKYISQLPSCCPSHSLPIQHHRCTPIPDRNRLQDWLL